MEKKQPGSDPQFYYWGEENQNVQHPLKEHGACAISANSTHPERALMVYDLLRNDEECYRLLNYGIEGEDYIVTEDGQAGQTDGFDSSTDAWIPISGWDVMMIWNCRMKAGGMEPMI